MSDMRPLAFVFAIWACSCHQPPIKPAEGSAMLTARLGLASHDYARDSEVEVTVDLANMSPNPITLPAQVLQTAILLLEVTDAKGHLIPTVPPSVPREDKVTFAPNEHRSLKVTLGVFSPPLPTGDYIVAPRASVADGNSARFHIR